MWLDNEARDAADFFWRAAGEAEPFPRVLERSVLLALPVALVKLPRLALVDIERWLQRRGPRFSFDCQNRFVRGCLIAFQGNGLIFVDGTDPPDELRFTIAHEASHLLLDYLMPRQRAGQRFGSAIYDVMDGLRAPSVTERLYAILDRTSIGIHTNLMERNSTESEMNVWKIEERTDRLALELLAPFEMVLTQADITAPSFEQRFSSISRSLVESFGLPLTLAQAYGHELLDLTGRGPSLAESFRLR
jgi:hypothetical protein